MTTHCGEALRIIMISPVAPRATQVARIDGEAEDWRLTAYAGSEDEPSARDAEPYRKG